MAGMGPDIYMRHPAPVKDNSLKENNQSIILTSTVSLPAHGFLAKNPKYPIDPS
jgi:hypothetical protein